MKRLKKIIVLSVIVALVAALFTAPAFSLGTTQERLIVGKGSVGAGVGTQTTLVDFTTSNLCGFETLGAISAPTFVQSGAWGTPVLYTWIDSAQEQTGIFGTLETALPLQNANTLSVQLLAQYTKTTSYTVTLLLEGKDQNGAPFLFEASTTASSSSWQTVTFDVSAFVAEVDLTAPCVIKVLTSSGSAESEQFVLWVHSIYTSSLTAFPEYLLPVAAAACGFLFGFSFYFVIYRATCKRNRRARREVR